MSSRGLEMVLLGSGSPVPRVDRAGPAWAVIADGDLLLFDTGRGAVTQLQRAGLNPRDLVAVFITHHHSDHICDLADVMFTNWIYDFETYLDPDAATSTSYGGRDRELEVIGPRGTERIVDVLHREVYGADLRFRAAETESEATWDSDLIVRDVEPGVVFERPGRYRVLAGVVEHGTELGGPGWVCLGYRIECGSGSVCIAGDSAPSPGLIELAKGADLLVQTCAGPAADLEDDALAQRHPPYFSWGPQAGEIAEAAGVGKIVLTHMMTPHEEEMLEEVRANYSGDAVLGRDLMRFAVGSGDG
jgi:ribonuclease Z